MPNSAPLPKHRRAALKKSPFILSHDGTFKSFWNWMLLFVTFYVVVVEPYNASFLSTVRRSMTSSVVIRSFFTMDMVLNFRTTYVTDTGEVVSNPRAIAINYVKTWFIVDLLAALPLDMLYAFGAYGGEEPVAWYISVLKLNCLLRLLRLLQKSDCCVQDKIVLFLFLLVSIALLSHWLCCVWYVIGMREYLNKKEEWNNGWIHVTLKSMKISLKNAIHFELYVTALYYTSSIITTVGFGNVSANTTSEKIFTICAMLIGELFRTCMMFITQRTYSRLYPSDVKQCDHKDFVTLPQVRREIQQSMQEYFPNMPSADHVIDIHEEESEADDVPNDEIPDIVIS